MYKRFLLIAAFLLSACGTAAPAVEPTTLPTAVPTAEPTVAPTSEPTATPITAITVTDSAGRTVTVPQPVVHIVSLAPSTTEIVAALDGLGRVAAVDMYSDYPADVTALPKVTNPDMTVNYEQIAALKPDVVYAAGITAPDVITAIEKLGIVVVVVGAPSATFASVLADIALVGKTLQRDAEATALTVTMQTDWDALAAKVAGVATKPTVFWELDATDPAKPYTVGPGSFVQELLTAGGGVNIFADAATAYPQVSLEQIVAKEPAVILLADSLWGVTPDAVADRAGWATIPAVAAKQVFPIDDNLVSRPGPRIVDGLRAVVAILHPDVK